MMFCKTLDFIRWGQIEGVVEILLLTLTVKLPIDNDIGEKLPMEERGYV